MPSALTRWSRLCASSSGGPNNSCVPAMSMPHRERGVSRCRSSIRGENAPAHSSRSIDLVAVSRLSGTRQNYRRRERFLPPPGSCRARMPSKRAFVFREQTYCNGGSPSMTTHGCCAVPGEGAKAIALEIPSHRDTRRVPLALSSRARPGRSASPGGSAALCGGLRNGTILLAFCVNRRRVISIRWSYSREYRCFITDGFRRLELKQQFSTALCTRILREEKNTRLSSLRCRPIAKPGRERDA